MYKYMWKYRNIIFLLIKISYIQSFIHIHNKSTMKATIVLFALIAPAIMTSPLIKRDPPAAPKAAIPLTAQDALDSMVAGASGFGPAFLAGDAKGVLDALNGMIGGAATFTPGFFNNLAKAAQASQPAAGTNGVPNPPPQSHPSVINSILHHLPPREPSTP
jgi:hypothetical protein